MEKDPLITEGTEIARNGAAHDKGECGGPVEEWISEEALSGGVRDDHRSSRVTVVTENVSTVTSMSSPLRSSWRLGPSIRRSGATVSSSARIAPNRDLSDRQYLGGHSTSLALHCSRGPTMRTRFHWASIAARLPTALLFLALAGGAAVFAADGARVIAFPYPMDYGEGPLLAQTRALAHGEAIYRADLTAPPYTIANYPPLYPLTLTAASRVLGPAFWYGRLLSWLSIVAAAVLIGAMLRALTGDRTAAAVGGLFLLAFPAASYWASLYRVDALALALSLGGLYVCVRSPARWAMPLAAALFTAAIYTRQSYGLAAPLAAAVWLLGAGRGRRAAALVGLIAILGAGFFGGLQWLTRGGFSLNIVTANLNEFQPGSLARYVGDVWTLAPIALLAAGGFLLLGLGLRPPVWRLVAPYLLGAALSALTIGKVGSNVNYLLELGAAVALSIGGLIAWVRPRRAVLAAVAGLLALDAALMILASPYRAVTHARLARSADAQRLEALVRDAGGPVLADEDMGLLPRVGRPIYFQPFEMTQLARAGHWDQRPLVADIERQTFAAILIFAIPEVPLHRQRWTDEMLGAIERRYAVSERVGQTLVFRPRPRE